MTGKALQMVRVTQGPNELSRQSFPAFPANFASRFGLLALALILLWITRRARELIGGILRRGGKWILHVEGVGGLSCEAIATGIVEGICVLPDHAIAAR
jgi:hypothetical protein